MGNMENYRKLWSAGQKEFRRILLSFTQHDRVVRLFFRQHAMLHSAEMGHEDVFSFEDEILEDIPETRMRRIPKDCEHSVAWCIWHIARIEDVAMNLLVAGSPQVFIQDDWAKRMKISVHDTGNAMDTEAAAALSDTIDLEALRAYRLAVGRRTRAIVGGIKPEALKQKVDPARLQQVRDEGAVLPAAEGLLEYWGRRTLAGLLLMPATRHNFVHLNEAERLKRRRG